MKSAKKLDQRTDGTQFWKSTHFVGREGVSRRMLFRHVAAGVGGYFLLPQAPTETIARAATSRQPRGSAKQVIFLMLAGAPSHVDTFDLKEGAWTPKKLEPTSYGDVRFPRGLMPKLADRIGDLVFARSVRSWAVVHGLANQWIQMARNPTSASARFAPHIGSVVSREFALRSRSQLPSFFSLNVLNGPGSGFLPVENSPIYMRASGAGLSPETPFMDKQAYARRSDLLRKLEAGQQFEGAAAEAALFKASGASILFNEEIERLFRFAGGEPERYGNNSLGNACLIAKNLLQSGLGVRYIEITAPGWDHHGGIYTILPTMTAELDSALSALMDDLRAAGMLDETLIVVMGEFGRTVGDLNGQGGRDHYPQQAVMFAGGGVRGQRAIGVTDAKGGYTVEPGWSQDRNMRAEDVAATIYSALGIDWTTVVRTENGIRFEYVPILEDTPYVPIDEIWGV